MLTCRPFIDSIPPSKKQWIYNILEGKKEVDRVLYRDSDPNTGYCVVLDWQWSGESISNLHVMAICNRKDIASVRDLNASHLPMLRAMKAGTEKVLMEKFNLPLSLLKSYIHYQPSYYHFHIHFSHILDDNSTSFVKAMSLTHVISSIEICPDFFSRSTISYKLSDDHALAKYYMAKAPNSTT